MNHLLLAAALILPAGARAMTAESLHVAADAAFLQSPALLRPAVKASAQLADEPFLQSALIPRPVRGTAGLGAELARASLAAQLDKNLHVKNYVFGARPLDLGLATDASFKKYYLTFSDQGGTVLKGIDDLNKLRSEAGLDVAIDASTRYNFRAELGSIFNDPRRNSILHMKPLTGGPSYDTKTGEILDAIRAQATVFSIDGDEYWMVYGRDAAADGSGFAATRSFLFIKIGSGFDKPKAWPLAESALTTDAPYDLNLGNAQVRVTRTSSGDFIIASAD